MESENTIEPTKTVQKLNAFLRGELSAVETYRQALTVVNAPAAKSELLSCEKSHQERVERLNERILTLGGAPAPSSGLWGSFAMLVEKSAVFLGERSAVAALEEGEDRGMADYTGDLSSLDADSRQLVENELLPAQKRTHRSMSALKAALM